MLALNQVKRSRYCQETIIKPSIMYRSALKHRKNVNKMMVQLVKTQKRINCGKVAASTLLKFPSSQRSGTSFEKKFKLSSKRIQQSVTKYQKRTRSSSWRTLTTQAIKMNLNKL